LVVAAITAIAGGSSKLSFAATLNIGSRSRIMNIFYIIGVIVVVVVVAGFLGAHI
jgi:hypothetical protein